MVKWRAAVAEVDDPASVVRTLAVMLQAGATPHRAWQHLAASGDPHAERVVARVADGVGLADAIAAEEGAWADVAAAWQVATTVGAPLAEVLRSVAEGMRDAADAADDVRVALAEPAGTARLLLWMPVAGLLLGVALGFNTLAIVVTNIAAALCVVAGGMLVLAARLWTGRMLRLAQPPPGTPGMYAELVAVGLAGGVSIERALEAVRLTHVTDPAGEEPTQRTLELSRNAGVPAGELLSAAAAHERHSARVRGRMRAAKLSTQLLIPLGVCSLPAFLLMGIAPLIISVLSTTPLLSAS